MDYVYDNKRKPFKVSISEHHKYFKSPVEETNWEDATICDNGKGVALVEYIPYRPNLKGLWMFVARNGFCEYYPMKAAQLMNWEFRQHLQNRGWKPYLHSWVDWDKELSK